MKPIVAITIGDCNGIGPEVAIKASLLPRILSICVPLLIGHAEVFAYYSQRMRRRIHFLPRENWEIHRLGNSSRNSVNVFYPSFSNRYQPTPGKIARGAGEMAATAIECAVRLTLDGHTHAVVTAPISKKSLHKSGILHAGHTEYLQALTGAKQSVMVLASSSMRVGLASVHLPLRKVSMSLTRTGLKATIGVILETLQRDWSIRSPRIAVLGLNPHAGEDGDIGREELEIIRPVIRSFKSSKVDGPFPADAFFGRLSASRFDAIVAMYHDQGLIPLKMDARGTAVNVTAGLPIVRTSPDHGTAFDIAGKNKANPESMARAIELAVMLARNRSSNTRRKVK